MKLLTSSCQLSRLEFFRRGPSSSIKIRSTFWTKRLDSTPLQLMKINSNECKTRQDQTALNQTLKTDETWPNQGRSKNILTKPRQTGPDSPTSPSHRLNQPTQSTQSSNPTSQRNQTTSQSTQHDRPDQPINQLNQSTKQSLNLNWPT